MGKLRMLKPTLRTADLRTVKPAPKVGLPFYSTPEWIALRDQVRRESGGKCQMPGCTRGGYIVDHIVEIRDGGAPLGRENVMNTCSPCHGRKTAAERAKRAGIR